MAFFDEPAYHEYHSSKNAFANASLILGGIAIVTFSSIYPAIFAGSLSIIFAMLSRRGTKRLHPLAKVGSICSAISVLLGILMLIFSMIYLPKFLKNDSFRSQMESMLHSIYGSEVDTDSFLDALEEGSIFKIPGTSQKGEPYDN